MSLNLQVRLIYYNKVWGGNTVGQAVKNLAPFLINRPTGRFSKLDSWVCCAANDRSLAAHFQHMKGCEAVLRRCGDLNITCTKAYEKTQLNWKLQA